MNKCIRSEPMNNLCPTHVNKSIYAYFRIERNIIIVWKLLFLAWNRPKKIAVNTKQNICFYKIILINFENKHMNELIPLFL